MKILNLFCSCNDFNTDEHFRHARILNKRYIKSHTPQSYIYLLDSYRKDNDGLTLLERCIVQGKLEIVEELLRRGAKFQQYSLHRLIEECDIDEDRRQFLLSFQNEISLHVKDTSKSHLTILQLAAKHNRVGALKFIREIKTLQESKPKASDRCFTWVKDKFESVLSSNCNPNGEILC